MLVAGGLGRRLGLGVPKALVPLRGLPLAMHALRALFPVVSEIVIAAPAGMEIPPPTLAIPVRRVIDRGDGPLGGVVAACVWDHGGGQGPLSVFWEAVHELDPDVADESDLPGAAEGSLAELFRAAGLSQIEDAVLSVTVAHPTFDEWWQPFTLGVGPAGSYAAGLDATAQTRLRERCRELLPDEPFALTARAWAARARAG